MIQFPRLLADGALRFHGCVYCTEFDVTFCVALSAGKHATGERGVAGNGPAVKCGIATANRDVALSVMIHFNVLINTAPEVTQQEGHIAMELFKLR
jgi:shikimate kinase